MERRGNILIFNVVLGVSFALLLTFAARRASPNLQSLRHAFVGMGCAGLLVGLTVGAGATVGPRPPLPYGKCLWAHVMIVVSSVIAGVLASLLPREFQADQMIADFLDAKGIALGSGIGAAAATVIQVIQVYRKRRKKAPRK